jgi:hypothetical protein
MQFQRVTRIRRKRRTGQDSAPGSSQSLADERIPAGGSIPLGRRGVLKSLTAAAIAAGAAVLGGSAQPDRASANGAETPTVFTSTDGTTAAEGDNTFSTAPGGIGVQGTNISDLFGAVEGHNSGGGGGFYGTTAALPFPAIEGDNQGGGIGVQGTTISGSNAGVEGDNSGAGPGVLGNASSGGIGVQGVSSGGSIGYGVIGSASNGAGSIGVSGSSDTGYGFVGHTTAAGGAGAVAYNTTAGYGFVADSAGGTAGYFGGAVIITGGLTVMGANFKSAAVRGGDGNLKRLYCVESPESWFEDFGTGKLSGGSASVQLEPGFAELVKTDAYHVFLTPEGESKGWLYVGDKTATQFTVQEAGGGTSNIGFSYRVVAKRKDIAGVRLEHVHEPPTPILPTVPKLTPATPTPRAPRRHGRP